MSLLALLNFDPVECEAYSSGAKTIQPGWQRNRQNAWQDDEGT
jgi:hypothetical protein